jgi:hypothetical protein
MEFRSGTNRQGPVSSHTGTFRTLAAHLERVLIRIPGVHCAAWSAVLSRSSAEESIVHLANRGDSSNQIASIGAALAMAGQVAQLARIAR